VARCEKFMVRPNAGNDSSYESKCEAETGDWVEALRKDLVVGCCGMVNDCWIVG
jgi:hypothetical protein